MNFSHIFQLSLAMKFMEFLLALIPVITPLISVILAAFIIKIHGRGLFDKKRRYHPVAGTVFHQLFNYHRLLEYMIDLASQRKTYRLLSFIRHEVYTADPLNIEHILVTNFETYGKVLYNLMIQLPSTAISLAATSVMENQGSAVENVYKDS